MKDFEQLALNIINNPIIEWTRCNNLEDVKEQVKKHIGKAHNNPDVIILVSNIIADKLYIKRDERITVMEVRHYIAYRKKLGKSSKEELEIFDMLSINEQNRVILNAHKQGTIPIGVIRKAVKKVVGCSNSLVTSINIKWGKGDILRRDATLTEEQVSDVLLLIEREHNCNEGINWYVIDRAIKTIKELDND